MCITNRNSRNEDSEEKQKTNPFDRIQYTGIHVILFMNTYLQCEYMYIYLAELL